MSKKRTFMLKNIDSQELISVINTKYSLVLASNLTKKEKEENSKTTRISDIISSAEQENSITFLDENKKQQKCCITMIEFISKNTLPENTDVKCFWCRNNFQTKPIGCPIKFVNSMLEKSYVSHITKDKYYMKENITKNKLEFIASQQQEDHIDIQPISNNYYLTDGIFCSFNCVLAFIKDNNHDLFYRESYSLLHSLYEDLTGKRIKKMIPAPSWRLLKDYGGHLSITDFRNGFNMIEYELMFNLRDIRSISKTFKEKAS